MKEAVYIEGEYHEFEDLIKGNFDVPHFEILADLEANTDAYQVFYIESKGFDGLDEYSVSKFNKWLESKGASGHYVTHIALNKLAKDGKLKEGKYLMSW